MWSLMESVVSKPRRLHVLIALLISSIILLLYTGFESYEEEIERENYRYDNHYLAAKMLMEKRGVSTSIFKNYARLFSSNFTPTNNDVVILTDSDVRVTQALSDNLLKWVEDGGSLILAVSFNSTNSGNNANSNLSNKSNALFSELGIETEYITAEDGWYVLPDDTVLETNDGETIAVNLENSYRITLPQDTDIYYSAHPKQPRLNKYTRYNQDDGNGSASDIKHEQKHIEEPGGWSFIQLERGAGLITLMTDVYVWNNEQLDDSENAVLLTFLADDASHIYFFTPTSLASWYTLLFQFAPFFVCLSGLCIALILWKLSARFGPLQNNNNSEITFFSQHIKASGDYYWRTGQHAALLNELRSLVLNRCYAKWPSMQHQAKEKLYNKLSQQSGWSEQTIADVFDESQRHNAEQFTKLVGVLQQLRNML